MFNAVLIAESINNAPSNNSLGWNYSIVGNGTDFFRLQRHLGCHGVQIHHPPLNSGSKFVVEFKAETTRIPGPQFTH